MRNYIILFIIYELLVGAYFYTQYVQKVQNYHENTLSIIQNSFDAVENTFTLITDDFYSSHADSLAKYVSKANERDENARVSVREEVLDKYIDFYKSKNLDFFAGMHIFDKNGDSFLRFHKPYNFGDSLIPKRHSLEKLYQNYSFQSGVEVGVYDVTYRYQYPLFYDGEFVGAYEYNLDFSRTLEESKRFEKQNFIALFNTQNIDKIMKPKEISIRFEKVTVAGEPFYVSKNQKESLLALEELHLLIEKKSVGSAQYELNSERYALFVLPLKNISNQNIGCVIVSIKDETTQLYMRTLVEEMLIASILSLIVLFLMLKELKHKAYVRNLLDRQKEILIVTDGSNIKDTNQSFLDFFGFATLDDFKAEHDCVCDFFEKEDGFLQKYNDGVLWIDLLHQNPNSRHRVKIKSPKTAEMTIFDLEFESFSQRNSFLLLRDITKEYHQNRELENRASIDALTKIYNRVSFEQELAKELKNSSRYGMRFSLIMFDIDHFKNVNDTYGHDVGDIILQELTALVSDAIRETDFFARWGGEEFMIITHTEIAQSELLAEKLRSLIEENQFSEVESITSSFGVAQYRRDDTKESIVKRCDEMLYSAKNSGRNCVVSIR